MPDLLRMGPLTQTNIPWLDAFPPRDPRHGAAGQLNTEMCESTFGKPSPANYLHASHELQLRGELGLDPKNWPYFKRSGNCCCHNRLWQCRHDNLEQPQWPRFRSDA